MTDPLLSRHRAEILRVAHTCGASNVRVFGSRARGEGDPSSDIDLLISLEAGRTLLDLVRLKRELEEMTAHGVDLVTDNGLSPILRDKILAEAVPL